MKNLILLTTLFLVSCGSVSQITETSSIREEAAYIEAHDLDHSSFYNQLMIKPTWTYFFIMKPDNVSKDFEKELEQRFVNNVTGSMIYTNTVSEADARAIIGTEGAENQRLEIYLDSLTMIAVSDRDIITPMGKKMGVDQVFVIQFDQWPCATCEEKTVMRLKARVVDVERGLVFWTGIAEKEFEQDDYEYAEEISLQMVDELTGTFFHKYKLKWQHKRFNGLKRLRDAG